MDVIEELLFFDGLFGDPNGEEYAAGGCQGILLIACPFSFVGFEGDAAVHKPGEKKEVFVGRAVVTALF